MICGLAIAAVLVVAPQSDAKAQLIREIIKKAIKAVDLMVQRLQNKTIALQNAQKVIENKLSELKLKEIAEWTEKHRKLYQEYYDELWQVKKTLFAYQRIRKIVSRQAQLVEEYRKAWSKLHNEKNFTSDELDYMYKAYQGIIEESVRAIDQLILVINPYKTQMTDAQRLALIDDSGDRIDKCLVNLFELNRHAYQLSLNRAKGEHEIEVVRKLYGL